MSLLDTNGVGKTTLINAFMGIIPAEGEIYIIDQNVRTVGASFLGNNGYLPQCPKFYKDFSVQKFLRYMCMMRDTPGDVAESRIASLLETVNLTEVASKKVGTLSGGMRQRLGIAQVMLMPLNHFTSENEPRAYFRESATSFLLVKEKGV